MPLIFIDTDNSDAKNKLYNGTKAGGAKAEGLMQKAVKEVFDDADGFTTSKTKDSKGYAIKLTVTKVDVGEQDTKCSLSGELLNYPREASKSKDAESGSGMAASSWTGNGKVNGTTQEDIEFCVQSVAKRMATEAIPKIKEHFKKMR